MANDAAIWDFLIAKIGNSYGVAGLMGNLYVESRLESQFLEGSYSRKLGLSSDQYTKAVDSRTYTNFVHDSAGYGLAQWTYWSRKEALLNYAKANGKSIGNLNMQLNYLWEELQKYKTVLAVLKSAKSVREASDIVVERYEKPANQSEKLKENRANYGKKYYDLYAQKEPSKKGKRVVTTADRVNVRNGNALSYGKIDQVPKGTFFEWIATAQNNWHAVKCNQQVGWICGDYCKIE